MFAAWPSINESLFQNPPPYVRVAAETPPSATAAAPRNCAGSSPRAHSLRRGPAAGQCPSRHPTPPPRQPARPARRPPRTPNRARWQTPGPHCSARRRQTHTNLAVHKRVAHKRAAHARRGRLQRACERVCEHAWILHAPPKARARDTAPPPPPPPPRHSHVMAAAAAAAARPCPRWRSRWRPQLPPHDAPAVRAMTVVAVEALLP
jgi:hypothetical protein